ncbi:DUF6328 family protein [Ramlibacter sp. MMS24-I3-19]|uniref:DUF6328 family protein n=1 Tax=Ramlibacter sp. MMS24-I3-19 TaxID=3416606 RepID=UPI003D05BF60
MAPQVEQESLKDEMRNVVEEARMIIPGVQALFGFQTMAVFNNRFEDLPQSGVAAYVAGLAMLAVAIALLMAPAACHRMSERGQVSRSLIDLSSRLITWGMLPLMLGLSLDIFVVVLATMDDLRAALVGGVAALLVFSSFWYVMPAVRRRRNRTGSVPGR